MRSERRGMLFCLIGPTASGKSTLGKEILKSVGGIKLSVSATSRIAREGEVDGVHYHFITEQEFRKKVSEDLFFEWEEVHGNLYGTLKSSVTEAVEEGYDLLLDIDIQGALNFKQSYPEDSVVIFVVPPSTEILMQRLKGRGEMAQKEVESRLDTAKKEFKLLKEAVEKRGEIDYFIVNDCLEESVNSATSILRTERLQVNRLKKDWINSFAVFKAVQEV